MKKRIKIIDLLCLVSNGEEVPKKIKYQNVIYTWGYDTYTTCPDKSPDKQMNNSIFQRYRIDYILNDEVEILDEEYNSNKANGKEFDKAFNEQDENKDIPLIPDVKLYKINEYVLLSGKSKAEQVDWNFRILKEKINQVVKELNEYRKENEL